MCRCGISSLKLEGILISHLHGDHVFGVFGLLSTMALLGRTAPLSIIAPAAFSDVLALFYKHFADGVKFDIDFKPLNISVPEIVLEHRNFLISAFPLKHRIETFGYLVEEKTPDRNVYKWKIESENLSLVEIAQLKNGFDVVRENGDTIKVEECTYFPYEPRKFAYCSDTAQFPELEKYIEGVDLLYHEATFGDDKGSKAQEYFHSTARQAGELAAKAGVKKLVIGHYSSRYPDLNVLLSQAKEAFPETCLSDDGMTFDIPVKKNKRG